MSVWTVSTDTAARPSGTVVRSLWMLAAAAVGLLSPAQLVQVSMFFDGGLFATVACNLAMGLGEPWRPTRPRSPAASAAVRARPTRQSGSPVWLLPLGKSTV